MWNGLAGELGRHVLERCPRWAIFVEGVGHCGGVQPAAGHKCTTPAAGREQNLDLHAGTWWGENLQAAASHPVDVGVASNDGIGKVVYSPHSYGPSTSWQEQFDVDSFPRNMPAIWDVQFGHLARDGIAPVVIGELGGLCDGQDAQLQQALVGYMAERSIGGFWWAVNPESGDTGGLLEDDWRAPESRKLNILSSLPSSPVPRNAERASTSSTQELASNRESSVPPEPPPPLRSPRPPCPPSPVHPPPPPYLLEVSIFATPPSFSWPPVAPARFAAQARAWLAIPPPPPSSVVGVHVTRFVGGSKAHASGWLVGMAAVPFIAIFALAWCITCLKRARRQTVSVGVAPQRAHRRPAYQKRWQRVPQVADRASSIGHKSRVFCTPGPATGNRGDAPLDALPGMRTEPPQKQGGLPALQEPRAAPQAVAQASVPAVRAQCDCGENAKPSSVLSAVAALEGLVMPGSNENVKAEMITDPW